MSINMKAYDTRFQEGLPALVVQHEYVTEIPKISEPKEIYHLFHEVLQLHLRTEEYVYLLGMNTKGSILGIFEVGHGSPSTCIMNSYGIFQRLLLIGATAFVVVHNHPSGDPTPYILAAVFYWILAIVLGVVQKKVEKIISSAYQK